MPAEKVYGNQHRLDAPGPLAEGTPPQVPIVDVRWGREQGYVQIVTKAEDPFGGRFGGDEDLSIVVTDGYYVDLGRKEINDLIRNLRRARDQAFGRDE
jgi:hypothetical protein